MRTTRTTANVLAASLVLLVGSACSSSQSGDPDPDVPATSETTTVTPSDAPSESPSAFETPTESEPPVDNALLLSVSIVGGEILPNAEQIELGDGATMLVEVESDRAGELHVHAKPEQFLEFGRGTTNTELTIETPGTVEIEDHETGAVVAILEIR